MHVPFPFSAPAAAEANKMPEDLSKGRIMQLTAVFMQVPEGYIAFVEELPGANTQGDTLEEARENLREAVELVLEANRELAEKSLSGQSGIGAPFQMAGS